MTVSSTTNRVDYIGNGAVSVYAYSFRILAESDLRVTTRVISTGVEATLVLNTDYTVSGVGAESGGNVTLTAGVLASTYALTIRRVRPLTQSTDIRNQGDFYPEGHEDAFDHLVMIAQQHQDEIDRSIKTAETDDASGLTIPDADTRANKFLAFDADGDPIASTAVDSTPVSTFMETVLDDTSAADARTTLGFAGTGGTVEFANIGPTLIASQIFRSIGTHNIAVVAATTTNASDSIKITSASGTALSSTNPGYVVIDTLTGGGLTLFTVTADVTILLTAAHWGFDTRGDITDQQLVVYAINDNAALKWGIGLFSQLKTLTTTDDETAPGSVTTSIKVLVNSALSASSTVLMVARVNANFDDTGGAAENLWAVQTGQGDIRMGFEDLPIHSRYTRSTNLSITNATEVTVDFSTLSFDRQALVTTGGSWAFTVPISGYYSIIATVALEASAGWLAGQFYDMRLYSGASHVSYLYSNLLQASVTHQSFMHGTETRAFSKGDTFHIKVFQNSGGAINTVADALKMYIEITFVGQRGQ